MGKRILYVDDNLELLDTTKFLLDRQKTFTIETENDPVFVANSIMNNKMEFDLFIIDLKMPGLDGIGLYKIIRNFYSEIPIIMATTSEKSNIIELLNKDDQLFYFDKTKGITSLLPMIEMILETHKLCQAIITQKSIQTTWLITK